MVRMFTVMFVVMMVPALFHSPSLTPLRPCRSQTARTRQPPGAKPRTQGTTMVGAAAPAEPREPDHWRLRGPVCAGGAARVSVHRLNLGRAGVALCRNSPG